MDNKGQAVLAEHVMIFFVVIAAIVSMTVFVQRGLEARIHDARNFMRDSVVSSGACDANCLAAAGGNIYYEYEPYYSQMYSDVQRNDRDFKSIRAGNANAIGAIYYSTANEESQRTTTSGQLPALCAAYPNGGCPFN